MQLNIQREYIDKISNPTLKLFKATFEMANEIRALKGQPALTKQQFISWLKGL
jgi:hypothetical protein